MVEVPQGSRQRKAQQSGDERKMSRNGKGSDQPQASQAAVQAYTSPRALHVPGSEVVADDRTMQQAGLDSSFGGRNQGRRTIPAVKEAIDANAACDLGSFPVEGACPRAWADQRRSCADTG